MQGKEWWRRDMQLTFQRVAKNRPLLEKKIHKVKSIRNFKKRPVWANEIDEIYNFVPLLFLQTFDLNSLDFCINFIKVFIRLYSKV